VTYKLDDERRFVRTKALEPVKAGPQS
jgi:hypothetical protein